jgi:outer membrane lipopolysaccharide assembly protein LptE/RlpB
MKKLLIPLLVALTFTVLLSGCSWQVGGGSSTQPTVGQQLIDLQKAKDRGAITDSEYQTQKEKLLSGK